MDQDNQMNWDNPSTYQQPLKKKQNNTLEHYHPLLWVLEFLCTLVL